MKEFFKETLLASRVGESAVLTNGWRYSNRFKHLQKVNKAVYVYLQPIFGGLKLQMYLRGETSVCNLDAQLFTKEAECIAALLLGSQTLTIEQWERLLDTIDLIEVEELYKLAENWLEVYGIDPEGHQEDRYYPFSGKWSKNLFAESLALQKQHR